MCSGVVPGASFQSPGVLAPGDFYWLQPKTTTLCLQYKHLTITYMRRLARTSALLLLFHLPLTISCSEDDCGAGPPRESVITEMAVQVGSFANGSFSADASTSATEAAIGLSILDLDYRAISMQKVPSFSMVNTAQACSPPEPQPSQQISSISITSAGAISLGGTNYPSGEELASLFLVASRNASTIADFIAQQNADLHAFGRLGDLAVFQLATSPDAAIDQTFTITLHFDDQASFSLTTDALQVDP